jgi:hypothetical protein
MTKTYSFGILAFSLSLVAGWATAEPVIYVPRDADRTIRIAAEEFRKYYTEVTGVTLVVREDDTADEGVRIGFPLVAPLFDGDADAFIVKGDAGGLVIAGKNPRSVLYGVYEFFKQRCGCRWFWDGDLVPKTAKIDFAGTDIREKSQFLYRGCQYFAHRALKRFQAELWGFDDWKKEIDWALKNRLNLVMLQTGIEDLFQLAFPDVVTYPDPDVTQPTDAWRQGYNYRTPLWSLQFRNLLRKAVLNYARDRGLMHPVVFGPRTHWYSRTPKEFLDKMRPETLAQDIAHYSEPSGQIWDVRKKKWFDMYFKLTEASIDNYGYSGLLFNPGFDERVVYTNREQNANFKIEIIEKFNREAARRYPDAKLLMEGWDFFGHWTPDEVKHFTEVSDPARTIFFNFTSDEDGTKGLPYLPDHNNFTMWGLTNRFPYVFGYMLELNRGSDIRCNYAKIRERENAIRNDPMCKGYVIWPEASHTDIFAWRYFTDNCWKLSSKSTDALLADFCRDRYGAQAEKFLKIWSKVIAFSHKLGWQPVFTDALILDYRTNRNRENRWNGAKQSMGEKYAEIPIAEIFAELAEIDWEGEFVRRDAIDLARTTLDRALYADFEEVMKMWYDVKYGNVSAAHFRVFAERYVRRVRLMADILSLHEDFSIAQTLDAVNAVEKVRNPRGEHLLFENSACDYCRGHQAEYARGWYVPLAEEVVSLLVARAEKGDFSSLPEPTDYLVKLRALEHPIRVFAPDPVFRTKDNFWKAMLSGAR